MEIFVNESIYDVEGLAKFMGVRISKMKRIVIVGGGVAGLSAGIFARKAGYEVEIYEKHTVVGGQCTGWWRKGFFIDNCVHWLTGTKQGTPLYKLWKDVGVLGFL